MAKKQNKVLNIAKKYVKLLNNQGFDIISAYLFGSYANNKQHEWSDIDLAVISDKFEGVRFNDKEKLRGIYRKVDDRLSILPLNPDSLDDMFIQSEVIRKGIKII